MSWALWPLFPIATIKDKSRIQSPIATKVLKTKGKKVLVANIETLQQCVAKGMPRRSLSLPGKETKGSKTYILLVGGLTIGLLSYSD